MISVARPKILISSRDVGAAKHTYEIALSLMKRPELETVVVASEPARKFFVDNGLCLNETFQFNDCETDASSRYRFLEEASKLLAMINPDIIIVGLSGPGVGVDEAMIACAGDRITYAMQDFWGDVNYGFGEHPKNYFVLDHLAEQITRARVTSLIHVVGSPAHCRINRYWDQITQKGLRRRNLWNADSILLFCGQPLWFLDGYNFTLDLLAQSLIEIGFKGRVSYRPHPKEKADDLLCVRKIFKQYELNLEFDQQPLFLSLSQSDLICSCFSTVGIDLAFLNRVSAAPLGALCYLMLNDEISTYYFAHSGLDFFPLERMGLATLVKDPNRLSVELLNITKDDYLRHLWWTSKKVLTDPSASIDHVGKILLKNL